MTSVSIWHANDQVWNLVLYKMCPVLLQFYTNYIYMFYLLYKYNLYIAYML